jgi:hypothetical protein
LRTIAERDRNRPLLLVPEGLPPDVTREPGSRVQRRAIE